MNVRPHADWRAGGHIGRDDWRRGVVINYRDHHLRRPPRGYEWREVDGNFVLAAVTTGGFDESITVSGANTWAEIVLVLAGAGACAAIPSIACRQ